MVLNPEIEAQSSEAGAEEPRSTVVLRPSRARWLALLVGCLVFAAIGVIMVDDGAAAGWFITGGFGLGAMVTAVVLLPGSSYLKVRRDGFVFGTLFRRWHLPWTAVGPFSVALVSGRERVVFDVIDPARMPRHAGLPRTAAGANAALPDTYGMTAGELAGVLNAARERALTRASLAG